MKTVKHVSDRSSKRRQDLQRASYRLIYRAIETVLLSSNHKGSYYFHSSVQAIKWGLSSHCFSLMLKSRQITSAPGSILSPSSPSFLGPALIYRFVCAQNYHLTPHDCGPDSVFCFQCRPCITDFTARAMISFEAN